MSTVGRSSAEFGAVPDAGVAPLMLSRGKGCGETRHHVHVILVHQTVALRKCVGKGKRGQKDMLACVDVEIDTSEVCFIDQGLVPPGGLPPYVKAWKYVATSPQIRLDTLCS